MAYSAPSPPAPTPLNIDGLSCVCLPLRYADFADVAAIYVILCVDKDGKYIIIDIGQSRKVGSRINSHDREDCWKQKCPNGNIWVCVYRMPANKYTEEQRLKLEQSLRARYFNLCGVQ